MNPSKIISLLLLYACFVPNHTKGESAGGELYSENVSRKSVTREASKSEPAKRDAPRDSQSKKPRAEESSEGPLANRQTTPDSLPLGLLVSYAQFEVDAHGEPTAKPAPARLEIIRRSQGQWRAEVIRDPDSNVFHKAMSYKPVMGRPGILTFGGSKAVVKLWRHSDKGFEAQILWQEDFGGRFSRMRDAEIADVYNDGRPSIVVGTHDQGVVAVIRPDPAGAYEVIKLGKKADTFVHEIEVGDLDGDNVQEIYATLSQPNRLDGSEQRGSVVRYIPKYHKGPDVIADLGNRHAKEIFVGDVDGDGRDELYVAVEALTEGAGKSMRIVEPVEIRRYDADTAPDKGRVVAVLQDRFCRFLTVGDVDGDGHKEMVASAFRSGVWLLRPPSDNKDKWQVINVDSNSSGFEHAALLADLDGDHRDELYVAADDQGELRRYTWQHGKPVRETIRRRRIPGSMMTWNIMPISLSEIF